MGLLVAGCVLAGSMSGCSTVIGPSIKADVIDWDAARSGARREGAYFATWNFAQKGAGAIGGWILGLTLAYWGYQPNPELGVQAGVGLRTGHRFNSNPARLRQAVLKVLKDPMMRS